MKLKMAYFDFKKCELCFLVPKEIMYSNRWGNVPEGVEVDLSKVTDNSALGIAEFAATDSQHPQLVIAARSVVAEWGRKDFDGVLFGQLVKNLDSALQQQAVR